MKKIFHYKHTLMICNIYITKLLPVYNYKSVVYIGVYRTSPDVIN